MGEYPANCKQTWLKLQSPDLPMSWLSGTKFAVFGLGDSTYSQFCVAAIGFDTRLGELGGQRLLKRGVGDDRDEDRYYTGWEAWLPELWQAQNRLVLSVSFSLVLSCAVLCSFLCCLVLSSLPLPVLLLFRCWVSHSCR